MKEIGQFGVKAVTLGGCGEPFLHKSTARAIEIAVENGTDVGALTNGIPIRDKDIPSLMENMTYLRFSVNGGSANLMQKYINVNQKNGIRLDQL